MDDRIEDLYSFLDMLNINKAILMGHSAAGDELTAFTTKYPSRVAAQLSEGVSEDESYHSREARRKVLPSLFLSEYGVAWNLA